MRGPIDYIIVGFEGNKFNGKILPALEEAIDKGIVALVALALVVKDDEGNVAIIDVNESQDSELMEFSAKYGPSNSPVTQEDLDEVAELLENNSSAGLLAVEQLWAKPLKQAIIESNGVLIAEGRIHPEAAQELDKEGE